MSTIVDAACCYQNGVYKCSGTERVPESCTYNCGVAMVPFLDGCADLLNGLFPGDSVVEPLTKLYDSCREQAKCKQNGLVFYSI
jgi:hypothetical protein